VVFGRAFAGASGEVVVAGEDARRLAGCDRERVPAVDVVDLRQGRTRDDTPVDLDGAGAREVRERPGPPRSVPVWDASTGTPSASVRTPASSSPVSSVDPGSSTR